jgi:dephospho-CoA kinase
MFLLGLTGSIAMGKSTAAAAFQGFGVPVLDADRTVHRLLAPGGGAVASVESAFAGVCGADGGIDRRELGRRVFGDPAALARLEAVLHPLVRAAQRAFLGRAAAARVPLVVLDIPLLFETGAERRLDAVVVVSAPAFLQAQRVLRRPGMDAERLAAIRGRQLPDAQKRRLADFVVPTGLDRGTALAAIGRVILSVRERRPRAWPALWARRH